MELIEVINNFCSLFNDYIKLKFIKNTRDGKKIVVDWKTLAKDYYTNKNYKLEDLPSKFWEKPEYGMKLILDELNEFNKIQDKYLIALNKISQKYFSIYNGEIWYDILDNITKDKFFEELLKCFKLDIEIVKFVNYVNKIQLLIDKVKPDICNSKLLVENGTFNFETMSLEQNSYENGINFKLDFIYEPCEDDVFKNSKFYKYIQSVLPDLTVQKSLQEYFAYIVSNMDMKVEKVAFLIGSGSNGKSVLFDIVKSVLGKGMSTVSLADLLKENDTSSHLITSSLINYCSETGNLNHNSVDLDRFKKLVSGEPIIVKLLFQNKFSVEKYCRFIVNGNKLPPVPENSNAWFRRFLIIPFEQTFSGAEKDMNLLNKILDDDGKNIFLNWIIRGYQRLKNRMRNIEECNEAWKLSKGFPFYYSKKVEEQIDKYKLSQSSSYSFLTKVEKCIGNKEELHFVYKKYINFCDERYLRKQNREKFIGALLENDFIIDDDIIYDIKVNYKPVNTYGYTGIKDEKF